MSFNNLEALKALFRENIGQSDALIHVNVGLGLFLLLGIMLRRKARAPLVAFIILFIAQTANEAFDVAIALGLNRQVMIVEMFKDFIATLFWPAILAAIWGRLRTLPQS